MRERPWLAVGIGAVVALLLQIIVAPNLALFSAQPNFLLAYVLVVAIVRSHEAGPMLPFVLGLAYDLLGTGPVGAMALLFVIASAAASRAFSVLDNDTLFMPLTILAASVFGVEMLYGMLLMLLQWPASLADVFLYRALPCTLYDCVVGLIMFPIMTRVLNGRPREGGLRAPRLR